MAAASNPFSSLPTEIKVINRLSSGLCRAGRRDEPGTGRVASQKPVALAPFRDDVPLLDPCSGHLSAGARVQLGIQSRTEFIDPFSQWLRKRPQTTASLSVQGSAVPTQSQRTAATLCSLPEKHAGHLASSSSSACCSCSDDSAALRRYIYTSSTQRSYEEVNWGMKFSRSPNAAGATLERRADPVSERTSSRRYSSRPQLWQSAGAEWNRRQLRRRNDARKPISFCSRYARSGQIPSFTTTGSENMDDIDNMEADFQPLTVKRSVTPSYTPTAHRTTMPAFTGKGVHAPPAAEEVSISGVTRGRERAAPLSRMVTSVTPCNPYLSARLPAWRGFSPVKMRKF
ncbi:uncharacterized protein C7orf72 isoform X2 [Poecilia latipinna]|uniref:uncharacterized protein C7orf72 isoform X2 n=1 Tax=Poecilia latipinna TaxID=48699 RepID=UPI00072E6CC2|nr:PREDICTED: uncharacterized protein C7orf72 homolog isoform X2 [Poecilia latipinna]